MKIYKTGSGQAMNRQRVLGKARIKNKSRKPEQGSKSRRTMCNIQGGA